MKYEYLIANNGSKLYSESEIIEYIECVDNILSDIRSSFEFGEELMSGDLSRYREIEQSLQLRSPNGDILDNYDILMELKSKHKHK